jgi:hypothetical protein
MKAKSNYNNDGVLLAAMSEEDIKKAKTLIKCCPSN